MTSGSFPVDALAAADALLPDAVTGVLAAQCRVIAMPAGAPDATSSTPQAMRVGAGVGLHCGDAPLRLVIALPRPLAARLAHRWLGDATPGVAPDSLVPDAVAELANLIAGRLVTQLAGSGIECRLGLPVFSAAAGPSPRGAMAWRCDGDLFHAHLEPEGPTA